MRAIVSKWGDSLALRLPAEAAARAGLREGAIVDLIVEGGKVVLRRPRYDIRDLVSRIAPETLPPLIDDASADVP